MMRTQAKTLVTLVLVALALAGCGKKTAPPAAQSTPPPAPPPPPLKVASVEIGNRLDAEKKIASPTAVFGPRDTLYASVATEGTSQQALLGVRWMFLGDSSTVSAMTDTIAPTGPATTEFHVASTGKTGWPVGAYEVEVMLDGTPAGSQKFLVQKPAGAKKK